MMSSCFNYNNECVPSELNSECPYSYIYFLFLSHCFTSLHALMLSVIIIILNLYKVKLIKNTMKTEEEGLHSSLCSQSCKTEGGIIKKKFVTCQ